MRAFVALELPEALRAACAAQLDAWRGVAGRLRLTGAADLHVTLAFLGEVEEGLAVPLADALRPAVAAVEPWTLHVAGVGGFPTLERPRVLWFGVRDKGGHCAALHAAVWAALAPLGFTPEARPFHPHITFARLRSGRPAPAWRRALAAAEGFDAGVARTRRAVLMRSAPGGGGPRYAAVAALPLG